MITSGRQIAAARTLSGWRAIDLAKAAGLHRNAIGYWERETAIPTSAHQTPVAVRLMTKALKSVGVTISEHGIKHDPIVHDARITKTEATP